MCVFRQTPSAIATLSDGIAVQLCEPGGIVAGRLVFTIANKPTDSILTWTMAAATAKPAKTSRPVKPAELKAGVAGESSNATAAGSPVEPVSPAAAAPEEPVEAAAAVEEALNGSAAQLDASAAAEKKEEAASAPASAPAPARAIRDHKKATKGAAKKGGFTCCAAAPGREKPATTSALAFRAKADAAATAVEDAPEAAPALPDSSEVDEVEVEVELEDKLEASLAALGALHITQHTPAAPPALPVAPSLQLSAATPFGGLPLGGLPPWALEQVFAHLVGSELEYIPRGIMLGSNPNAAHEAFDPADPDHFHPVREKGTAFRARKPAFPLRKKACLS